MPYVTRSVLPATCLTLLACMSMARGLGRLPPGYGVTDDLAIQACGTREAFEKRVEEEREWLAANDWRVHIPRVSDTLCDVLAQLGAPEDMDMIESDVSGRAMHLTYRTGALASNDLDFHSVWLRPNEDDQEIVVTDVVW